MRVLFITTGYPCDSDPMTGVFHRTAAESLKRNAVDIEVVAPVPYVPPGMHFLSSRFQKYHEVPQEYLSGGIRILRPRYLNVSKISNYFGLTHYSFGQAVKRAISHPPDVIHAHYSYPCGAAGAGVGRAMGIPVVLTLHGSDVNNLSQRSRPVQSLFKSTIHRVNAVIAVSEALSRRCETIAGKKPMVMPIGIDLRRYRDLPDKSTARQMVGLPADKKIVVFIGNLTPAKGVNELLQAWPQICSQHEVLLLFIGDGPLRSEVSDCPNAIAKGLQPNEMIPHFLAAADALVLPSYSEGMPTVLIEAGAAGVPIIATSVGGIPELLGTNAGLTIAPKSIEEIVSAVRQVFDDPEAASERAHVLKQTILEKYDVDRNGAALKHIYEKLIKNKS